MQNAFPHKLLTILCICLSSLPLTLNAGGGEYYSSFYKDNGFNILYDGLLNETRIARTSSQSPSVYNGVQYEQHDAKKTYNLLVWQRFLRKTTDEIEAIVYRGELSADLPIEVSDYLHFVQLQQPLVNPDDVWNEIPAERAQRKQQQHNAVNQAIAAAEEKLKTVKTPFIRQRYVFLMIRLAHYSAQYDQALQLYARYTSDIDKLQNEVAQWIYSLRAGALQHIGKFAESAYAFAKVFSRTRSLKMSSHLDFRIKTDAQWDALMTLCKNNDEKALMHYMRALKSNANSLQELQQVYQLAPNSSWVNALLFRELEFVQFARGGNGKLQTKILIDDVDRYAWSEKNQATPQKIARRTDYLNKLSQIVATIKTDNKRRDLFLVDYATLYLRLLSQQPITIADVTDFQQKYAYTTRTQYTTGLAYFVYLENLKSIDANSEQTISTYLEKIQPKTKKEAWEVDDVMDYTYNKLAPLYVKSKQKGKAYIAQHNGYIDPDEILVGQLRELNSLAQQENPHFLIKQMTRALRDLLTGDEYTKGRPIEEMIARKYLAAGLFEQAKEKLDTLPQDTLLEKTAYNPFTTSKSGNNRIKSTQKTLLGFTETMLTLQQQIATTPDDANAHFLLATAYYNMTWFGNSPMIVRYNRSTYQWNKGEIDLSKAKKHYELALQYATDKELTAKTLYALAKIEEKELGIALDTDNRGRWPNDYNEYDYMSAAKFKKAQGFGKYFKKIDAYKDTKYFKEVIQQCADYQLYSGR